MKHNDITVAIPWRPTPDRIPAYDYIRKYWAANGFDNVIVIDSDPSAPFHRAQARNRGVAAATTEKVILADADTITDIAAVNTAVAELDSTTIIYPHTQYRLIASSYIGAPDLTTPPAIHTLENAQGGIIITTRTLYQQLGGMDERFDAQWGYEDAAFALTVNTLARARRINGMLISFEHRAVRDMTNKNPNKHRYTLYELCNGRPELMRELIKR